MSNTQIEIYLDGGEAKYNLRRYRPGDTITGQVVITTERNIEPRHIYASLEWQTAGRGTTYKEQVHQIDLYKNGAVLSVGLPNSYRISFPIPEKPWSYEGHYIKIHWKVSVKIDLALRKDPYKEQMILVEPDRESGWGKGDGFSSQF